MSTISPRATRPLVARGGDPADRDDAAALPGVVAAVRAAGACLLQRFDTSPRFTNREQVVAAIHANDDASLELLRPALTGLCPRAGWVEDELDSGALPAGEWWVTDPVEGNVNHVHGMSDWAVSATLVRDNTPVLTAVHLPLTGEVYTAALGAGAQLDGRALRVAAKTDLSAAIVGTGQASPREGVETARAIGASATAMLSRSLVLRVSVPATLQLLHVAAGRMDAFWQAGAVRSGLLAGALLVTEAGGVLTDNAGQPWGLHSETFVATTPSLHAAVIDILSTLA